MQKIVPADFRDYAMQFPPSARSALREMRAAIKEAAPKATERISYNLPAFALDGKVLVWFAAFKSHIGFYPGAAAIAAFASDLSAFKTAKGSVQFPLDGTLPLPLVRRMVKFKMRESK